MIPPPSGQQMPVDFIKSPKSTVAVKNFSYGPEDSRSDMLSFFDLVNSGTALTAIAVGDIQVS